MCRMPGFGDLEIWCDVGEWGCVGCIVFGAEWKPTGRSSDVANYATVNTARGSCDHGDFAYEKWVKLVGHVSIVLCLNKDVRIPGSGQLGTC